jgi:hypothetical protein
LLAVTAELGSLLELVQRSVWQLAWRPPRSLPASAQQQERGTVPSTSQPPLVVRTAPLTGGAEFGGIAALALR